jgi:hypothetical protein
LSISGKSYTIWSKSRPASISLIYTSTKKPELVMYPNRSLLIGAGGMRVAAFQVKSNNNGEESMLKRVAAIVLAVTFISLAAAPETLAFTRGRRDGSGRTVATNYYSSNGYRGVGTQRYYSQPYYGGVAGSRYNGSYYRDHSTRNLILTVAAPAAVGAGIGAIAGGGKGAGIGAAIGGGGGALFYLLKHHGRRY